MDEPVNVPPHDLDAEAAVLSAAMNDRVALDKALEILPRPDLFYSESHRRIWEACIHLATEGGTPDITTVATWLRERDRLAQVGGMAYLTTVLNAAPALANIEAYAKAVADTWTVRQAILTCQRHTALGYSGYGNAADYVNSLAADVFELEGHGHKSQVEHVGPIMHGVFDEIAKANARGVTITGIPTGYDRYDRITSGLHSGELTVIAARPGMGKAQSLDARVLTPTGWRFMGEIREGDQVIDADGKPTEVRGVFERGRLQVYRVTFDDGTSTECCGDHLWTTRSRAERRAHRGPSVRSTDSMRADLRITTDDRPNYSAAYVRPVEFHPVMTRLPLDPWLLGALLGDGQLGGGGILFHKPEADVQARVAESLPAGDVAVPINDGAGMRIKRLERDGSPSETAAAIRAMGLDVGSAGKFIPEAYLRASVADREKLLQGLLDTDGYVTDPARRSIEFTTVSGRLADDVVELARSLGGTVSRRDVVPAYTHRGESRRGQLARRLVIAFPNGDVMPVSSQKHRRKFRPGPHRIRERFIVSIEPTRVTECRCISVASPTEQYVTDDYLVTHNTSLVTGILVNVAGPPEGGWPPYNPEDEETWAPGVVLFSLEMPRKQIVQRMMCSHARVDVTKLRTPQMITKSDWERLSNASSDLHGRGIYVDDQAALTTVEMRAKLRRKIAEARKPPEDKSKRRVRVVVAGVDYVQLMRGRDFQNREQEVASITRDLKTMAKELGIPILALAQLNRAVETRGGQSGKRPMLSDLRESGAVEQDADNIVFIYRDDYYNKESPDRNVAELIIAKQRNGPTDTVRVRWDGMFTRFDNLAEGEYEGYEGDAA